MSPRDGLQNEKKFISTDEKVFLIDQLSQCGFNKIETSSFVSHKWVPQLADATEVFRRINRNKNTKYTALTPNERGFNDALTVSYTHLTLPTILLV